MAENRAAALTDVGTNELEVVEFFVDDRPYAINVAKVREIIRLPEVRPVPESHPDVLGVFRNREEVIPLVDLGRWLGSRAEPDPRRAKVVVAEFNNMKIGFRVHGVSRIHRVTWADLETPREGSVAETPSALGFIRLGGRSGEDERIVFLLDFERIVAELRRAEDAAPGRGKADAREGRSGRAVLVAEDSPLIRKMILQQVEGGGYSVVATANGLEAWEALDGGVAVDAVITDIEMPQMDGHHLTRRIKEDPRFRELPVILYSSMIYEEMRRKGDTLGADAQLCKPDLPHLLGTLDRLIFPDGTEEV